MKILYGIGTGPGDAELLTLKAVKTIERSDVIFAPNNKGKNMALDTAKEYVKDKRIVLIDFPMGAVTKKDYEEAARIINREIPKDGQGAFLTIGDPMIYSTFIYLMEEIERKSLGIQVNIIPGIPSFVAAAAAAKLPLTVKGDNFLLCDEFNGDLLKNINSISILKSLRGKEEIQNKLEKEKFDYTYVRRISLEEEGIMKDREKILSDRNYMSLILARKTKEEE